MFGHTAQIMWPNPQTTSHTKASLLESLLTQFAWPQATSQNKKLLSQSTKLLNFKILVPVV